MKYKILKECVLDHIYREIGEVYEVDKQYDYIDVCIEHGFLEPIKEPEVELPGQFKPKKGETYFSVDSGCASPYFNCTQSLTDSAIEIGLSFKTKEECQKWIDRMKAYQILCQDAKGFKPDWKDFTQNKIYVLYNYAKRKLDIEYCNLGNRGNILFATDEDAEESIKNHKKEWLTLLEKK